MNDSSIDPSPFFSVIIPTYNRGATIRATIDSVLSQTYNNYELIIIDDGSTDHTKEVVQSYDDSRIIYRWQNASGSPAITRNLGLKMANGKYASFLDSDDYWNSDKLEIVCNVIKNNRDYDVITHLMNAHEIREGVIIEKGIFFPFKQNPYATIFEHLLLDENHIAISATVVKISTLKAVGWFSEDPKLIGIEDYDLWLRLSMITEKFLYIQRPLGVYTIWKYNLSKFCDQLNKHIYLLDKHANNYKGRREILVSVYKNVFYRLALQASYESSFSNEAKYHFKSISIRTPGRSFESLLRMFQLLKLYHRW